MQVGTFLDKWNRIPETVKQFILRALFILAVWKILYLFVLFPTRVLDKPLTQLVSGGAVWALNSYTHSKDYSAKRETYEISDDIGKRVVPADNIYFHNDEVVAIEDTCNALELIVLYIGFIIALPARLRRKVTFILGGIIFIYIINVLRCAVVTYAILYYPSHADFAHHYVFTFAVYGAIIALWLVFANKLSLSNAEAE